jgi:hypothetical protein
MKKTQGRKSRDTGLLKLSKLSKHCYSKIKVVYSILERTIIFFVAKERLQYSLMDILFSFSPCEVSYKEFRGNLKKYLLFAGVLCLS